MYVLLKSTLHHNKIHHKPIFLWPILYSVIICGVNKAYG
jgi:hypothetical protein